MSMVGLGSCRHLQSCSETHGKQFLKILCGIKKLQRVKTHVEVISDEKLHFHIKKCRKKTEAQEMSD